MDEVVMTNNYRKYILKDGTVDTYYRRYERSRCCCRSANHASKIHTQITYLRGKPNDLFNHHMRCSATNVTCLETMYWNCCEEKFCFDKKIVTYSFEDEPIPNGYANVSANAEAITSQPGAQAASREVTELPLHADKLCEIFSKSMIFREEDFKTPGSIDSLDELETKSEPDLTDKPHRTKVYFEDEVNSPITDFEIMFKDELLANHEMFKIDEEDEDGKSQDTEGGIVINVDVKRQDVVRPTSLSFKDESKITTVTPVYEYDPISIVSLPSTVAIPRVESLKGILRQKSDLTRSVSAKTLTRVDSGAKLKPSVSRVDSLKNIDAEKMNKVLSRVPIRSASYLHLPEHLMREKPALVKSNSTIGVSLEDQKLSKLPDTPLIKSNHLPRFFMESPPVAEYKEEISLQSIKTQTEIHFQENDFSMPRYYQAPMKSLEPEAIHESKSMPDLRNPLSTGKVSKRLVKIRSRLKPLVIRKGTDESH